MREDRASVLRAETLTSSRGALERRGDAPNASSKLSPSWAMPQQRPGPIEALLPATAWTVTENLRFIADRWMISTPALPRSRSHRRGHAEGALLRRDAHAMRRPSRALERRIVRHLPLPPSISTDRKRPPASMICGSCGDDLVHGRKSF